eukprot:6182157-Pleurochrysis_carterae.AAC.6
MSTAHASKDARAQSQRLRRALTRTPAHLLRALRMAPLKEERREASDSRRRWRQVLQGERAEEAGETQPREARKGAGVDATEIPRCMARLE